MPQHTGTSAHASPALLRWDAMMSATHFRRSISDGLSDENDRQRHRRPSSAAGPYQDLMSVSTFSSLTRWSCLHRVDFIFTPPPAVL